jgi:hypothetical protein
MHFHYNITAGPVSLSYTLHGMIEGDVSHIVAHQVREDAILYRV